jgi:transposase
MLFSQVVLGAQLDDEIRIRQLLPPTEIAARLRGFVQYRAELIRDTTRVLNRLTALCDEGFTEFTEIFADPNGPTALLFREKFPLPADMAAASIEELLACRPHTRPGNAGLARLRELAKTSIGNRDPKRLPSLRLEQKHLIKRLRLLQADIDAVEAEITKAVEASREGKILTSIPTITPTQAAIIISNIANIANFERASSLRGYCGWAPFEAQSGTSLDSVTLAKGGNKFLKYTLYLISWTLVRNDTEFRVIYERLVPIKCHWDERKQIYRGKNKVLGRICGQLIGLIFLLLRRDHDMLAALPEGATPPEPMLYSRETHRDHRLHGIRR